MISKQDRVRPRTPEDLERKYQNVLNRSAQQQQQAVKGEDGLTPYIGANGNWWLGNADTGVNASGTPVTFTPAVTEGNKVGTLKIGDVETEMFAPESAVNESGEHYIKVGETILTETLLQNLLALLQ